MPATCRETEEWLRSSELRGGGTWRAYNMGVRGAFQVLYLHFSANARMDGTQSDVWGGATHGWARGLTQPVAGALGTCAGTCN